MRSIHLVNKIKGIEHFSERFQRNAIQVGRLYMFRLFGKLGYLWRFMALPQIVALIVGGLVLWLSSGNVLLFCALFPLYIAAGCYVEQRLYYRMVRQGVLVYMNYADKAFYKEPKI
ncbi:hypothetical protein [Alteromonas facilis]|uniref:hypothetical protein n=1 Tax=Alteromonas facilis TaxID=2048004 RepID=UPI000C2826D4|nr:hypothetical protein [Alteromonas facilis]